MSVLFSVDRRSLPVLETVLKSILHGKRTKVATLNRKGIAYEYRYQASVTPIHMGTMLVSLQSTRTRRCNGVLNI